MVCLRCSESAPTAGRTASAPASHCCGSDPAVSAPPSGPPYSARQWRCCLQAVQPTACAFNCSRIRLALSSWHHATVGGVEAEVRQHFSAGFSQVDHGPVGLITACSLRRYLRYHVSSGSGLGSTAHAGHSWRPPSCLVDIVDCVALLRRPTAFGSEKGTGWGAAALHARAVSGRGERRLAACHTTACSQCHTDILHLCCRLIACSHSYLYTEIWSSQQWQDDLLK